MLGFWRDTHVDADLAPLTAAEQARNVEEVLEISLFFMVLVSLLYAVLLSAGDALLSNIGAHQHTFYTLLGVNGVWCLGALAARGIARWRLAILITTWIAVWLMWLYLLIEQHRLMIALTGFIVMAVVFTLPRGPGLAVLLAFFMGGFAALFQADPLEAGIALRYLVGGVASALIIWQVLFIRQATSELVKREMLRMGCIVYIFSGLLFILMEPVWPVGANTVINAFSVVLPGIVLLFLKKLRFTLLFSVLFSVLLAMHLPAVFLEGERSLPLLPIGLVFFYFILPVVIFFLMAVLVITIDLVFMLRFHEGVDWVHLGWFSFSQLIMWITMINVLPLWFKHRSYTQRQQSFVAIWHSRALVWQFSLQFMGIVIAIGLILWPMSWHLAMDLDGSPDVLIVLVGVFVFIMVSGWLAWLFVDGRLRASELMRLSAEAQQASEEKITFLSTLSHELRTPLNGIVGMLQVLDHEPEVPSKMRPALDMLSHSSGQLRRVVEDVIDIARLEKHSLKLVLEPVDLSAVLTKLEGFIVQEAKLHGTELVMVSRLPRDTRALTDEARLIQVIEFIGSQIWQQRRAGNVLQITFSLGVEGLAVLFESPVLQDEKIRQGILGSMDSQDAHAHQLIARVMAAFHATCSVHESRLSKQLALLLDVPIEVELHPQSLSMSGLAQKVAPSHVKRSRKTSRLLIVDDDASNRMVMQHLLESVYPKIEHAADGFEAIDKLQGGHFDVMITDVAMPRMNGEQLLQRVQALGIQIPVIALTGNLSDADVARFKRAGFFALLFKPVDVNVLRRSVGEALGLEE
jgi:CheY-like chemotaxis protein/signal transduction histidine kinase